MTTEQIENLQSAWFMMRDVQEETGSAELARIMEPLHQLIDRAIEQGD